VNKQLKRGNLKFLFHGYSQTVYLDWCIIPAEKNVGRLISYGSSHVEMVYGATCSLLYLQHDGDNYGLSFF